MLINLLPPWYVRNHMFLRWYIATLQLSYAMNSMAGYTKIVPDLAAEPGDLDVSDAQAVLIADGVATRGSFSTDSWTQ